MHLHSHAGVRFTDDVERLLAASAKEDEAEELATAKHFAEQEYKPESYRDYMMRLSGAVQTPPAANATAPTGLAAKGCPTCGGAAANTTAVASCPTCGGQNNQTSAAQQAPAQNATPIASLIDQKKEDHEVIMSAEAMNQYASVIADAAEDSEPEKPVLYSETITSD